uniref:protein disulfide-isomerase n=1 Tax=Saccoglossus kowalevskii TaxID=10224 RepID=A0ABM0MCV6_SACKO
ARTADGLTSEALKQAKDMVNKRLGKKAGGGGGGGGGGGSRSGGSGGGGGSGNSDDVVTLTDQNFEDLVLNSEDGWLVEFYAPWCGHCKNLAPEWASAATQLKGKFKLGALDATVETITANQYGVTDRAAENLPPPEIHEITEEKVLTDSCEGHQLCVISILPHILDTGAVGRNKYLNLLLDMADKYKKKQWGWVWAEAGSQFDVEESLGIGGFGYPAMAALNSRKMKYALLRGSFSEDGLNEFLRELSYGRGSTAPVKGAKLPKVAKIEAWDGKDGQMPVEEDYDLDDFDLDEDDTGKDEL